MAAAGRPAPEDLTDEPRRAGRGGAAAPAREVPAGQGRRLRRQLRGRRDRHAGRRRVRGQRPDVPDPARGAGLGGRHREGACRPGADLDVVPAAAAALLDRRADEPVHVDVDRGHARRRPAGGARRPARQRPHPRAGRRGRPPGAALHPLLGLPQRLPGLRAGRRPRLRLGLPRPDRRDPEPAAAGASASTSRPTRCPTPPRCAAPASRSARCASTSPRCSSTCAPRSSTRTAATACPRPRRVAMRATAWAFSDARRLALAERASGLAGRVLGRVGVRRCRAAAPRPAGSRGRGRLDRRPRPAGAAAGVVPRLVEAHRRGAARERP